MKAYEAWIKAKEGQRIHRISRPATVFEKEASLGVGTYPVDIYRVFGVDFSADDWEVIKEKRHTTFMNVDFSGTIGGELVIRALSDRGFEKPTLFAKVYLEWEE